MLPNWAVSSWAFQKLGKVIHRAHVKWQGRHQTNFTYFLRNVPLLELLRDLVPNGRTGNTWRVTVVGCSTGAELYSLLWYLRSARPNLRFSAIGADIVDAAVAKASSGEYCIEDEELAWLSGPIRNAIFDQVAGAIRIKDWIRDDIQWIVADATDPNISDALGPTNLLLANNFLGAMADPKAEECMENLLRLVSPGGYFVFNGDLDVKTRFARRHDLVPICDRIEAIHFGDPSRTGWPWTYWASEPIDNSRPDWQTRYSVVFKKLT
jgi:chemotaxis protein methyltransferase CheR